MPTRMAGSWRVAWSGGKLTEHSTSGDVWAIAFSPTEASILASGGGDNKVTVWDWKKGEAASTLGHSSDSEVTETINADGVVLVIC